MRFLIKAEGYGDGIGVGRGKLQHMLHVLWHYYCLAAREGYFLPTLDRYYRRAVYHEDDNTVWVRVEGHVL